LNIQMLVYPDMTLLDLVGPLQAWSMWPGAEIELVWKNRSPIMTDCGLAVVPTHTFDEAGPTPDILFAGGGLEGTTRAMADADVTGFMRSRGERAEWVTSVCTGALILGAAGLLEGYRATTHWMALDALPNFGAEPVKERWVIDRNRATGGGVTAGIDFGLALMAEIAGEDLAKVVQLGLEYDPAPPFDSGTPDKASPETVALVKQFFAAAGSAGSGVV
jgi:cyclohexyl-isocyanide hydratase